VIIHVFACLFGLCSYTVSWNKYKLLIDDSSATFPGTFEKAEELLAEILSVRPGILPKNVTVKARYHG